MKVARRAVLLLAVVVVAAACPGGGGPRDSKLEGSVPKGGVLIAAMSGLGADLDPQKEYYSPVWGLYRCCLLRTLLSFAPGDPVTRTTTPVPDLAMESPSVSGNGRVWTFRLKHGVRYAPPFEDAEIIAPDVVRALERLADPVAAYGGYATYFKAIEGFTEFATGEADSISGLETPDDHTLTMRLTHPLDDLGYRMSLPATAPIPEGSATGHDEDYGRYLVASGPYMIEGSEQFDPSQPVDQHRPIPGYEPGKSLSLVRNPSWSPALDPLRSAHLDRIEIQIGADPEAVAAAVDRGHLDISLDGAPTSQVSRYARNTTLKERMFSNPGGTIRFASLNLAVAPFDDVNVRRAVNHAVDKALLLRVRGGRLAGVVADHLIPTEFLNGRLKGYRPYEAADPQARLESAKEEMRKSRYDSSGDGICDAPDCQAVLAVSFSVAPYRDFAARLETDLAAIGIDLNVEFADVSTFYDRCNDPGARIALCLSSGWRADFPTPAAVVRPLFSQQSIGPQSCCNHSLVGADQKLLSGLGYEIHEVPRIEGRIEKCEASLGADGLDCWSELDRHLMEVLVPAVPILNEIHTDIVSTRVRNYMFDYWSGTVALDHVGVVD